MERLGSVALTRWAASVDAGRLEEPRVGEDSETIERIYREYGAMVYRRCRAILRREEDAEDAAQEVFIRAMRSLDAFRGQSSPATWLYRIATNICLNRIRDARNRERLDRERLEPPAPEEPVEAWPRDLVTRVMAEFDRAVRETVQYAVVEGMTYREIAEVMGCSISLVRKRLAKFQSRAPLKARRLLRGSP